MLGKLVGQASGDTNGRKPKLGRYENLKRELRFEDDARKTFVDIDETSFGGSYNFVDLFSGAGGATLGFKLAGYKPLAAVEISEVASKTHKKNFPECNLFTCDIRGFKSNKILKYYNKKDVHLVIGGPPCQGFSIAGKRDINDPRNQLFRDFIRLVKELKPWYVVMENVPGILTVQGGKVKGEILQSFKNIGYPNVSVAILESADYGVPQIRPRAIFIANRFGLINPFPKEQLCSSEYLSIESAISDLPAYKRIPEINHEWTRHREEYMVRISKVPPGGSLYKTYADAFKRQYKGYPSMTVKENHGGTHIHPDLNRVISAREMARLQTFPDNFIFSGSMKKAMWQIGNAVPPRLAQCIAYALTPVMDAISNGSALKFSAKASQF